MIALALSSARAGDRAWQPSPTLPQAVPLSPWSADPVLCAGNHSPLAQAFAIPATLAGQQIVFDASPSYDAEGNISHVIWDFGDGIRQTGALVAHVYEEPGEYNVTLTVVDECGAGDMHTFAANIGDSNNCNNNRLPIARAGADQTAVAGHAVALNASTSIDPDGWLVSYQWDFGDNSTSGPLAGPITAHTYNVPGAYTVTLRVTDNCNGTSAPDTMIVTVEPGNPCSNNVAPTAVVDGPTEALVGDTVVVDATGSFDPSGQMAHYWWNLGDGTFTGWIDDATYSHAYTAAGLYTVTLWVQDNCGALSLPTGYFLSVAEVDVCAANIPPTASVSAPPGAAVGEVIQFDASASTDRDGTISAYTWDFGDGADGEGAVVMHHYSSPGVYTARVTAADNCAASSSASVEITVIPQDPCVNNVAPVAEAGPNVDGEPGVAVEFDGSDSHDAGGAIQAYWWNFGDDSVAGPLGSATESHIYAAAGEFVVTLWVRDNCGVWSGADTLTASISTPDPCASNVPPHAAGYAGTNRLVGQSIPFFGWGSSDPDGTIASYHWDFGDGATAGQAFAVHAYTAPGPYTVVLTVTDSCGATDSLTLPLVISAVDPCAGNVAPTAEIAAPATAPEDAPVGFSAAASSDEDGDIVAFEWTFGDGGTATGATVSHTYANPGNYTIALLVRDDCGATDGDSRSISISAVDPCAGNLAPTADAGPPVNGSIGVPVTLDGSGSSDATGTIASYWWNFGNGQSSGWQGNAALPMTYASAGVYNARLWVRDSCGAISLDDNTTVTIINPDPCAGNQSPVANAGADVNGQTGAPIVFNGGGSSDPDGTIASYSWTFGDGGAATGASPSHAYAVAGVYTVVLTVTDNCGRTATDSLTATVVNPDPCAGNVPPVAQAGPDIVGVVGQGLLFQAGASHDPDGSIVTYHWTFGDGGSATTANAVHAYTAPGVYFATLTVTDNCGATSNDQLVATVSLADPCTGNQPPQAVAGNDVTGLVGQTMLFNGGGSIDLDGSIANYHWSFGDGQTAVGASVPHAYAAPGIYFALLTVTDNCGATAADLAVANISAPDPCTGNLLPTANAGPDQEAHVGVPVAFASAGSADPDGSLTSYWWNFGDGQSTGWQSASSVVHTYSAAGQFTVSLWVRDACLATSPADNATVTVVQSDPCAGNQLPTARITAPDIAQVGQSVPFSGATSTDPDGAIVSYQWLFGDAGSGSGATTAHTYVQPGVYTVVLSVTDACGAKDTETRSLQVLDANPGDLEARFAIERVVGTDPDTCADIWSEAVFSATDPLERGLRIRFNASSSTGAAFYVWELEPGLIDTDVIQEHVYEHSGTYQVSLTVYDAQGINSDTATRTVYVSNVLSLMDALSLTDENANDLALDGNTAWISHINGVLSAVNVANPANLIPISMSVTPGARAIAAANGYVYLCTSISGVQIYQGTLPTPTFRGVYNTNAQDGQRAMDAVTLGNVMFLAAGPAGVKVLDLRQTPTLSVVASAALPTGTNAQVVAVSNGIMYVADDATNVFLFDVSGINVLNPVPSSLPLLKRIDGDWIVHFLVPTDGQVLIAYSSPGGMFLYDISDPTDQAPNLLGFMDLASEADGLNPAGLVAVGDRLFAGFGPVLSYGTSVAMLDISNPCQPRVVEWLSMSGQVSGANRSPAFRNGVLFWANSLFDLCTVNVRD